jgi:hypothetical protein
MCGIGVAFSGKVPDQWLEVLTDSSDEAKHFKDQIHKMEFPEVPKGGFAGRF